MNSRPELQWSDRPSPSRRLIEALARHDEQAWNDVVQVYGSLVRIAIRRSGVRDDEAEDVLEGIWRIAKEEVDALREERDFAPWGAKLALRAASRSIQRRIIRPQWPSSNPQSASLDDPATGADELPEQDDTPSPEELAVADEMRRITQEAFTQLPERDYRLIHYLFRDQTSPSDEEIAERLGVEQRTIHPLRVRAFRWFRAAIDLVTISDW